MRIVGLETELALGFAPEPGVAAPTHHALFLAVAAALKESLPARPALYYKGGEFLADGSLLHFEVARLDAPKVGLLEWATPECLGALEAAEYSKAQEAALREAVPRAEEALAATGARGRLFLLKNNLDRRGNAHGCHESYDVHERPFTSAWTRLVALVLHPLALAAIALLVLAVLVPALALLLVPMVLMGLAHALSGLPLLGRVFGLAHGALEAFVGWVAEPGRGPGSGALAHASIFVLVLGARLFGPTARRVLFAGHQPALLPFLATRPVLAGAGVLTPEGRFELTPRARVLHSDLAAFIHGPRRPIIDVKELYFRRPLRWLAPRKRLHLLAGDSNRAEVSEVLKLATTELVLEAIEAGALDALAATLELRGGAVGALRATSADPTLRRVVARDRLTHAPLTALAVQRRYLEAVWAHARERATPAQKDVLRRWRDALERLERDPRELDRELDWAIKLRLLSTALHDALPDRDVDRAWEDLAAWGPVNALLEARAPDVALALGAPSGDTRARVTAALGWWGGLRARRAVGRAGLRWEDLPAVRAAWLRLKALDLRYHELSRDGGPFDRLVGEGRVECVLDPAAIERARQAPPARTRAAVRGQWVRSEEAQVSVGWERVEIGGAPPGEEGAVRRAPARVVALSDPYRWE